MICGAWPDAHPQRHDYFHDCLRDLVAEFFARGSARELDTACADTLRRPPFVTP